MEKIYEYEMKFANEIDYADDRIEPNNNWHTIQVPLKSLESAQTVLACLENNSIKFTRFWQIIRREKEAWREEVVSRSPQLVIYEKDCAVKHDTYVKSRHAKVEELNKMDKEFIIEEDFHGYKVFIERSEAVYKPDLNSSVVCHINIKFINSAGFALDFYLFNYLSDNKRLLKKKFFENFINRYYNTNSEVVTKTESDTLLEKIYNTVTDLNKILMS